MNLKDYFKNAKGHGVLATADADGKTNAALYARPHFFDDGTVAFIMAEKTTYKNLQTNPNATYLFIEAGEGYKGKRLYLTRLKEEQDKELINRLRLERSKRVFERYKDLDSRLVYFRIDKIRPLVGDQ